MNRSVFKGAESIALLLCLFSVVFLSACNSLSGALKGVENTAEVTKYYTYGAFLQLEGSAIYDKEDSASFDGVKTAALVLRTGDGEGEEAYRADVPFSVSKKKKTLTFRTAGKIDEGLCLDALETGNYAVLLEMTRKDGSVERWALEDGTGGEDREPEAPIEYYTLTHGRGHRKVTTAFRTFGTTGTLTLEVRRSRLPKDVYDIVIDPGHGGKDPGARAEGHAEKDIVLDQAKVLQEVLERAGYKVLLTRDGTEDPQTNMAYTIYDKDGRVNTACASKAKLSLSLHLNHSPHRNQNGVQIYRSRRAGDDLAQYIARGLVENTDLSCSTMNGKTVPGVYTRTFTAAELRQERAKAKAKGFTFYDATTSTDFYFMIREFGGIATGAYVDGRNPDYGTNEYRNSNQGVDGLLCELGFMTNENDLRVLLRDQRGIARGIQKAVDAYIDGLYEEPGAQTADLLAKENL